MPGFTLRLTDEQHATLTADAKRNNRSLQGEVIHRLFPPPMQTAAHPGYDSVKAYMERPFKPDPKPVKRK